jgi:outer membrane protein TolC
MRLSAITATAFVLSALVSGSASAGEKRTVVLNLEECIRYAVDVNTEIKEAEFEAEVYRGKQMQADSASYPMVDFVAYGSLSPRAKLVNGRTIESSTNIHRGSYDGVFGRAIVTVIQPLYTFGKISGYQDAAEHGVLAHEAGAKLKATEVAMLVKRAYYGLLLSRETGHLLEDMKGQLTSALDKTREQLDAGAVNVDQVDVYKLQTYVSEIDRYIAEAKDGEQRALYGLMLLTNHMEEDEQLDIADEYLIPADIDLEDFDSYLEAAFDTRLEFVQLEEGLIARESLIKAEYADYFPQIFVLGFADLAGATNRDHLNNPYVEDQFNHATAGAVLGLKWSMDLGMNHGQVNEAKAEYLKLKMKEYYAKGGIPYQVKEAYLKINMCNEQLAALNMAYRSAKSWLVASLANFDFGVGDPSDAADAVAEFARLRADYFRTVYEQRMAIAELEHATGIDAETVPYTPMEIDMDDLDKLRNMVENAK